MKKLKLIIEERGRYVEIPGIPPFRSPAKVDVSRIKISILIQSLHSCGVSDYKLVSKDENGEIENYTKDDIESPKKQKDKIENRLERLEDLLLAVLSKSGSQNFNKSEQITNRLSSIEKMLRGGVKTSSGINNDFDPIVEEIEDRFIPNIDVENMRVSNDSTEIISKKSRNDVDNAVDLLSRLANGGKK